jgi:hypothetical protein
MSFVSGVSFRKSGETKENAKEPKKNIEKTS